MEKEKRPVECPKPEEMGPPAPSNAVESFYENFRHIPLKYLDIFIGVCVGALVLVVFLGILKGRGIL